MDNRPATLLTRGSSLTRAEYRVLAHLTEHPLLVGNITVRELAQATFVSTATIMRLCQKLGFSGFSEFIWHCKQLLSDTPHITVQPGQHAEMPALLPGSLPTISRPSSGSLRTNASSLPACCARKRAFSTAPGFRTFCRVPDQEVAGAGKNGLHLRAGRQPEYFSQQRRALSGVYCRFTQRRNGAGTG